MVPDSGGVRVVQCRCGPGFPAEPLQRRRIFRERFGHKLQRDETTELGVFGLVDNPHATTADLFDDAVMRNGLANEWVRNRHTCGHLRVRGEPGQRRHEGYSTYSSTAADAGRGCAG